MSEKSLNLNEYHSHLGCSKTNRRFSWTKSFQTSEKRGSGHTLHAFWAAGRFDWRGHIKKEIIFFQGLKRENECSDQALNLHHSGLQGSVMQKLQEASDAAHSCPPNCNPISSYCIHSFLYFHIQNHFLSFFFKSINLFKKK